MRKCNNCQQETENPKYCSRRCAAIVNNSKYPKRISHKHKELQCLNCGKHLSEDQFKYCSYSCQHLFCRKEYICRWKSGEISGSTSRGDLSAHIRNYLFDLYKGKCQICGWGEINQYTGNIPLEVDHIDGNNNNNSESNLRLICPNCHSLTRTYKGANRGSGRSWRSKYYTPASHNGNVAVS